MPARQQESARTRLRKAIKNPKLGGENKHFGARYARLADVLDVVRPALDEAGLDVAQTILKPDEKGVTYMETTLLDGDETVDALHLPVEVHADPQKAGSLITYLRRYSLCTLLGIVGDEDDDGRAAARGTRRRGTISEAIGDPSSPLSAEKVHAFRADVYAEATKAAGRALRVEERRKVTDLVREVLSEAGYGSAAEVTIGGLEDVAKKAKAAVRTYCETLSEEVAEAERVTDELVAAAGVTQGWAFDRLGQLDGDVAKLRSELEAKADARPVPPPRKAFRKKKAPEKAAAESDLYGEDDASADQQADSAPAKGGRPPGGHSW